MTKRAKRLKRLQQNPRDVSFEELRQVLDDYGFVLERSSGSHYSFKVRIAEEWVLFVVPYKRPVKPVYVKEALDIIDQIKAQREAEDEGESDE